MINQAQLNALRLEADELNRRIFDLQKFAHSSKWKTLKGIEKDLLREQLRFMCGYANNLGARITYYERRMSDETRNAQRSCLSPDQQDGR